MLIDTSGKLFKGAAATAMLETTKGYIGELFRPWRVLKSCNVSPVGTFKTSSLNALCEVTDERNEKLCGSCWMVMLFR
jgi:hypothetical protein